MHRENEVEKKELQKIEERLYALDFSQSADKDKVKKHIFRNLKREEERKMKNRKSISMANCQVKCNDFS